MDGRRMLRTGAVLAATFGVLYLGALPNEHVGDASSRYLVIGVLSARDHFLQRDAVRRTWGSHVSRLHNSELLFMIGEYDCPVHPQDRISPYSCERWNILPEDFEDSSSKRFLKINDEVPKVEEIGFSCDIGIGFQILHPLLLESLSVSSEFLSRIGNCTIVLQDAEEILESVEISQQLCTKESRGNALCDIKLTHKILLPKHFEGELRVLQAETDETDFCGQDFFSLQPRRVSVCEWTDSSIIKYKYLRSVNDAMTKWSTKRCPILSASYSIVDRDTLKNHVESEPNRRAQWIEHLDFVIKKITIEQVVYGDIAVLPLLDVYSRLPQKMLTFLRRLTYEYDYTYLMKVDDDTFVNISSLKSLMDLGEGNHPKMWSKFHYHRSVPLYGKWADVEYPSLTYPTFPAGAGYLMSRPLVESLSEAGPHLTSYVGEDISMGIWVSSVVDRAILIDVPCWLPHSQCSQSLLIPQLSPIDMIEVWENKYR